MGMPIISRHVWGHVYGHDKQATKIIFEKLLILNFFVFLNIGKLSKRWTPHCLGVSNPLASPTWFVMAPNIVSFKSSSSTRIWICASNYAF